MCGISGRFNQDGRPVNVEELVAMRDVMVHRGPDGHGLFHDGPVGLGHRRLSIIDLEGGHQPLANEDGTVTIVFNGEIYNFGEIRQELLARGHTLKTRSDTEVIVHLYEETGADCVHRLRGMFAFAIWDQRKRQLLLARDRLGVKPLYYLAAGRSLLFASEMKALLRANGVSAEPDPVGLRRFLTYRHVYGDGTLLKGVRQLPPGHVLVSTAEGTTIRRYWDVPERDSSRPIPAPDEFLALLDEAVRLRMISDVPLGAFLSGGLDSSAITALMARHTDRVKTFSIGFVPAEESELSWARLVADRCGADHHEFEQGSEDFFSLLQKLIWHNDEPMMFPASIPLYLLSRESKRKATVMLAGEGADEILAGYGNNVRAYWLRRLQSVAPPSALRTIGRMPLLPAKVAGILSRATLDDAALIMGGYRLGDHNGLTLASRVALPNGADDDRDLLNEVMPTARQGTFLDRLLYFQLKTYLVALLMKQDKMSMAASIETRVPYLDHHLVGLAFSMPDSAKIQGWTGKHLLKQVSRRLLPGEVIDRPKRGFPVPVARWFRDPRNPFIDVLLDPGTLRDGFLDPRYVQARVEHFLSGANTSLEMWAMLNLELWRREYVTGAAQLRSAAS